MSPRTTLRTEGMGFAPVENRLVIYYTDNAQDIRDAAIRAGISVAQAKRILKRPEVAEEVQRRLEMIRNAHANMIAQRQHVTVELLDDKLVQAITAGAKRGDTKALELGYDRIGMRRDGNFGPPPGATDSSRPMIYRALERTATLTTTTTEQITERAVEAADGIQDY